MREKEAATQALIALGYHIKWLEYKLIDEVFLLSHL